jgi:hypothetical protein
MSERSYSSIHGTASSLPPFHIIHFYFLFIFMTPITTDLDAEGESSSQEESKGLEKLQTLNMVKRQKSVYHEASLVGAVFKGVQFSRVDEVLAGELGHRYDRNSRQVEELGEI